MSRFLPLTIEEANKVNDTFSISTDDKLLTEYHGNPVSESGIIPLSSN